MDGIAVGHSLISNALLVYNPMNKKFYELEAYRLEPYHIIGLIYPNIKYDGGLFCSLVKDGKPSQDGAYPPGTRVVQEDPATRSLCLGTVMDIPLDSSQPVGQKSYLIQFDGFTTISVPITDMPKFTPKPPVPLSTATDFLQLKKKITYEHKGKYYQGYIGQRNGIHMFVYKHHMNCNEEEWGIPLPDFTHKWTSLCVE